MAFSETFHVLSDIHVELLNKTQMQRIIDDLLPAKFLVLAGDIGSPSSSPSPNNPKSIPENDNYKDFLCATSKIYDTVFVILGNHEFYYTDIQSAKNAAKNACASFANVVLLDREYHDIVGTDIRIVGATLWTHIPPENAERVSSVLGDFRSIVDWNVTRHNTEHQLDTQFIKSQIAVNNDARGCSSHKQLVIITHHAPTTIATSNPRYEACITNCAFSSNVIHTLLPIDVKHTQKSSSVKAWIYGHTHHSGQRMHGNTMLLSNQKGTLHELETGFDKNFIFSAASYCAVARQ